jgi:hypothetical protein
MDMLGDLAMEGDEEFPELSEDTGDVLQCVRTDQYSTVLLTLPPARPSIHAHSPVTRRHSDH